ncbi:hypothetical protein EYF80_035695 [Liparis tanakae]|uniref:Uncharacterized protein n=1 Tax=Liparis tanakae TaxID=230148 RepID=A0A4Z2GMQ9_9TELE|nr:hypothetical protein EYF80_035695 [Liparis tanakae]
MQLQYHQTGIDKVHWTRCTGQGVLDKVYWTRCTGQGVLDKVYWTRLEIYLRAHLSAPRLEGVSDSRCVRAHIHSVCTEDAGRSTGPLPAKRGPFRGDEPVLPPVGAVSSVELSAVLNPPQLAGCSQTPTTERDRRMENWKKGRLKGKEAI